MDLRKAEVLKEGVLAEAGVPTDVMDQLVARNHLRHLVDRTMETSRYSHKHVVGTVVAEKTLGRHPDLMVPEPASG